MTKSQAKKLGLEAFDSVSKSGVGASIEREWTEVCLYCFHVHVLEKCMCISRSPSHAFHTLHVVIAGGRALRIRYFRKVAERHAGLPSLARRQTLQRRYPGQHVLIDWRPFVATQWRALQKDSLPICYRQHTGRDRNGAWQHNCSQLLGRACARYSV
jgi:hypothetical protein